MWAACIIKINDIARPLPKHSHRHTHCNRPVVALTVVFQQKDRFLFTPLALFVSFSLYLSLHLYLSFSTKCQIAPFLSAPTPRPPCPSTHLVINSKHIKPTVALRYSPDCPSQGRTHCLSAHTWVTLQNGPSVMKTSDKNESSGAKKNKSGNLLKETKLTPQLYPGFFWLLPSPECTEREHMNNVRRLIFF